MGEASGVTLKQVRQALAGMYDTEDLGRSELAATLPECRDVQEPARRAEVLRELLLEAIEATKPGGRSAPSASAFRAHESLRLRYVAGLTIDEIAEELSLGWRQVYRDLLLGEKRLREWLEAHRSLAVSHPEQDDESLLHEVAAIGTSTRPVDLVDSTAAAIATVAGIAERRGVSLSFARPVEPVYVRAIPGVAHQLVVQLVSAAVQGLPRGTVAVARIAREERHAVLSFPVAHDEPRPNGLLSAALRLSSALKSQYSAWSIDGTDEERHLNLRLPLLRRRRVLIVEDNPAAVSLYERYLADSEWEPFAAPHPRAAASLAAANDVDVVLLDIMMPDTDGWTVLQALKVDRAARDIPVVICSVVADTELGLYLGASEYLAKPVTRQRLLEALARATTGRSQVAAAPATPG